MIGLSDRPNPWLPILEIYALGCWPLGMVRAEDGGVAFGVYVPSVR